MKSQIKNGIKRPKYTNSCIKKAKTPVTTRGLRPSYICSHMDSAQLRSVVAMVALPFKRTSIFFSFVLYIKKGESIYIRGNVYTKMKGKKMKKRMKNKKKKGEQTKKRPNINNHRMLLWANSVYYG